MKKFLLLATLALFPFGSSLASDEGSDNEQDMMSQLQKTFDEEIDAAYEAGKGTILGQFEVEFTEELYPCDDEDYPNGRKKMKLATQGGNVFLDRNDPALKEYIAQEGNLDLIAQQFLVTVTQGLEAAAALADAEAAGEDADEIVEQLEAVSLEVAAEEGQADVGKVEAMFARNPKARAIMEQGANRAKMKLTDV